MQFLNILAGIAAVALIFISIHFSYAQHILDNWHKVEDKASTMFLMLICGAIILFAIGWNIFRFL